MQNFKNFKTSTDLTPVQQDLKESFNIEFCEDENGIDWYHCRTFFDDDTWKFTYASDGSVIAISRDATMLRPIGLSVSEINVNDCPDGFGLSEQKMWIYDNGKITEKPVDQGAVATKRRSQEIAKANDEISILTDAENDGSITPEESIELSNWRAYRLALRRLNIINAPDISWPERP